MPGLTPQEALDLAKAPQSTSTDGVTVTERPIEDVIVAEQLAQTKAAAAAPGPPRSLWNLINKGRVRLGGQ
jgi:hypothetical protein